MNRGFRSRTGLVIALFASGGVLAHLQTAVPGTSFQTAGVAIILDPANPDNTEIAVAKGAMVQIKPRVIDATGGVVQNAPLAYASLNQDVATVDPSGTVVGKEAGFSTLVVSSGQTVATGTLVVVGVESGVAGFEIQGITQDSTRRLYLANGREHTVLLASDLGSTPNIYAGVKDSPGLRDDVRPQALFQNPAFLAFNQAIGTLYVSDSANNVIRQVRPGATGRVDTLAGTRQAGGNDGAAAQATFNNPQGLALDSRGNLWVADTGNHVIRRINLITRRVDTVAGLRGIAGSSDGISGAARFNSPVGIALENRTLAEELTGTQEAPGQLGSLVVADTGNGLIRRLKDFGTSVQVETVMVETSAAVAGKTVPGISERKVLRPARFTSPSGVYVDPFGDIYVTEPVTGQVKTILINGKIASASPANTFFNPKGIVITQSGKVLVAEGNRSARQLSYGAPAIAGVSPQQLDSRGGSRVTISGTNFAPDTIVVASGVLISGLEIRDTQTLSFIAPVLPNGTSTLTVQNRGGVAQQSLSAEAVPLRQLSAGQITTVVGGSNYAGDGFLAPSASVFLPQGVTVDASGNVFIADFFHLRIRRVDPRTGVVTTVAGTGQYGVPAEDTLAITTGIGFPAAVAIDAAGNLIFSDNFNHKIFRVSSATGKISTLAGTGEQGSDGDNGSALRAELDGPTALAVDPSGDVLVADTDNHRIRRISAATGVITTVAGNGDQNFYGDNGRATSAALNSPSGIAVDTAGNLFIADTDNNRIRKVDAATGNIRTVAGTAAAGFFGDGPGQFTALWGPRGLAIDNSGALLIADQANHRIRRLDPVTEILTTVAGNGQAGFSGDGGPADLASLWGPATVAVDAGGNIILSDSFNNRVRRVSSPAEGSGIRTITTIAGNGQIGLLGDGGPSAFGAISFPLGISFDPAGNLFITDTFNSLVRRVDGRTGIITTVAGNGQYIPVDDGIPAKESGLFFPFAAAPDRNGNLFIADTFWSRIRKVDPQGIIRSAAGRLYEFDYTGDGGPATAARLNYPSGLVVDAAGNVFISDGNLPIDQGNHRVRRIDAATGLITTIAGNGIDDYSGDNGLAERASLNFPMGLALDATGSNLYIADTSNDVIRKVDLRSRIITTVAGNGFNGYSGDNVLATSTRLNCPVGVAVDAAGNLFIADTENQRVRRVDAQTRIITTVAGSGEEGFSGDGGPARSARVNAPTSLAIDPYGNLYIADTANGRIRVVALSTSAVPTKPRRRP